MPRGPRKDPRGGKRQGAQGRSYAERTDLNQAPRAVPSQTYGDGARQIEAQRAAPLPSAPSPGAAASSQGGTSPPGMAGPELMGLLAALPGLGDPSTRPSEPLTAGLPFGPGPGPLPPVRGPGAVGLLRRMVAENPDPDLFALLADAERAQGGIV